MNVCDENHIQDFRVTYKPAKGGIHIPVWLVCNNCMEKKYFGSDELIESVEKIT